MILFIDTHDNLITMALENDNNIKVIEKVSEYSHSIYCMSMIESLFKETNSSVNDLNKIIVVNGPGSFTGIRIGLSIAKTLSYVLKCDINTISSLDAYLISDDKYNGDKMAVIKDNKGYYIKVINDDKVIIPESYVTDLPDYLEVDKKLNVKKVINYLKNKESENPHLINANYIKKIEVEL